MNRTRSVLGGHMLRFVSLLLMHKKKRELKSNVSLVPHFILTPAVCTGYPVYMQTYSSPALCLRDTSYQPSFSARPKASADL